MTEPFCPKQVWFAGLRYWHECLEDAADFETADEAEDGSEGTASDAESESERQMPCLDPDAGTIMEPVKDRGPN